MNMSTGEIISQGRPRYPHRPRCSFWRRVGDGFSRFFGFVWSVLAFILSAVVFIWKAMGYIILYGGLLSIIVTVISVWISDGFFYALIAGVVSFLCGDLSWVSPINWECCPIRKWAWFILIFTLFEAYKKREVKLSLRLN